MKRILDPNISLPVTHIVMRVKQGICSFIKCYIVNCVREFAEILTRSWVSSKYIYETD